MSFVFQDAQLLSGQCIPTQCHSVAGRVPKHLHPALQSRQVPFAVNGETREALWRPWRNLEDLDFRWPNDQRRDGEMGEMHFTSLYTEGSDTRGAGRVR